MLIKLGLKLLMFIHRRGDGLDGARGISRELRLILQHESTVSQYFQTVSA